MTSENFMTAAVALNTIAAELFRDSENNLAAELFKQQNYMNFVYGLATTSPCTDGETNENNT